MSAPERNVTAAVRAMGGCPGCGFPVHPDQPVMRVHMGTTSDLEGYVVDLMPAFHRTCGAGHLIRLGRAKTETQRTRPTHALVERKAS